MTSQINPLNIDGSYPVAGQDNNSQGFRDNFTNIRTNFQDAADEITDLQNKVILKAALSTSGAPALNNNMGNISLTNALIQGFSATKVVPTGTSGTVTINYQSGHYQSITTTGSISLVFTAANWTTNGTYGYLKLQINITNVAHTVTLPAAVSLGTAGLQGLSGQTITFAATGTYEFGFGSYDGGATITIFDLNRALTNFSGADLTIDDITASGTANITGNVNGGNLRTAGLVSAAGNVIGGNVTSGGLIQGATVSSVGAVTSATVAASGNVSGGNIVGFIRPTAGSASQAPIRLVAGTNTSSPLGGSIEYDGVVFYGTSTDADRGVVATEQFIALVSDYIANDSASAQKVFNSPTNGAITLDAGTTYMMEGVYYITRALGSNSHTLGVLFALGGSLTSITYTADTTSTASYALGAVSRFYNTTASLLTVTAASTSTTENITVVIKGIVRTNAAGTFTPQIQYSSAPGGAPTILKNSYFKLTPVGNSTVASVGNWS
jgi:hypothetical protein